MTRLDFSPQKIAQIGNFQFASNRIILCHFQEAQQRTGLWQKFDHVDVKDRIKDINNFRIELDSRVRSVEKIAEKTARTEL